MNKGNYELEVLPKTTYLYHFSKLRNLIFLYFGGFWRVLVVFVVLFRGMGAFLRGQRFGK